jgi:hypothetical protein
MHPKFKLAMTVALVVVTIAVVNAYARPLFIAGSNNGSKPVFNAVNIELASVFRGKKKSASYVPQPTPDIVTPVPEPITVTPSPTDPIPTTDPTTPAPAPIDAKIYMETFDTTSTLEEASSFAASKSSAWWLGSGGYF